MRPPRRISRAHRAVVDTGRPSPRSARTAGRSRGPCSGAPPSPPVTAEVFLMGFHAVDHGPTHSKTSRTWDTPRAPPRRERGRRSDCDLEDFRARVARNRPADYPHADDVRANGIVYPPRDPPRGPACAAGRIDPALTDGPGVVVFTERLRHRHRRPASEAFFAIIEAQRADGQRRGRPLRQAPAPTTASGTPRRSWRCTTRRCSPSTTPTTRSRRCARPGSVRATRSPRRSTSSIPAAQRRFRTATTTSASSPRST